MSGESTRVDDNVAGDTGGGIMHSGRHLQVTGGALFRRLEIPRHRDKSALVDEAMVDEDPQSDSALEQYCSSLAKVKQYRSSLAKVEELRASADYRERASLSRLCQSCDPWVVASPPC